MSEKTPSAIVIGSGFGGLSAAIRLQAAGIPTQIFEKRDLPGGRAYVFKDEGFTFDAGPTVITAPHCLEELFELSKRKMSDYVELMPVEPFYRLSWEDGYSFDYDSSIESTLEQIRRKSPADADGYLRFLEYSKQVFDAGYTKLVHIPFLHWSSMVRVSPQLAKLQAYRSVYSMVSKFIRDPQLRQAFSFHSLLVGGNPFTTSSIYTLIHFLERNWGVSFPRGGTGALVQGLVRLFEDMGGKLHLSSEIDEIVTENGVTRGIRTRDGAFHPASIVVANSDVVHTYDKLLRNEPKLKRTRKSVKKMRQSMSLFLIYFGTRKKYPNLAHHTVVFGPRYRELLDDIFHKGVLADDFSLYLHAPTRSDPSLAPEGCEGFYVLAPVPNLEACPMDWKKEGPKYADRILSYLEKHQMPGLRENLVTQRIFTPEDFDTELNSHVGSAFSFEPLLTQSAYFRTHNRDKNVQGLYFVGAGTHPGAGVPGVVNSGKATANVVLSDLSRGVTNGSWKSLQKGSKTFSFAAKLFPSHLRDGASLVYAWCRHCDDQIDELSQNPEAQATRLESLKHSTQAIYTTSNEAGTAEQAQDPAFAAFSIAARKYGIPSTYPMDLLEGMAMDARAESYETIEDLKLYCYRVAGTVGLMMSHVMGIKDHRALKNACDLGMAMQLTNISRDILDDAKLGRVYLPLQWLREAGIPASEIAEPRHREKLAELVKRLVAEAESFYASGFAGLPYLTTRSALTIASAALIYRQIGLDVVARGARAWDSRVYIPLWKKAALALRAATTVLADLPRRAFDRRAPIAISQVWRNPS